MLKRIHTQLILSYLAVVATIVLILASFFLFGLGGRRLPILALIIATLVGLTLSVFFSRLLARSVTDSLQNIARAAEAISKGTYNCIASDSGLEEINQAIRSFNDIIVQFEANQRAMRDFVSNASHELKTPLTAIQGFAQALRDNTADDVFRRQRAADIIYDEATRMRRLIDDLLDLARIEAGQIILGKWPIDIISILTVTCDSLSIQAQAKNVTLHTRYEQLPPVVGDGDRLAQVFLNLIDNAIKHTPAYGKVVVQAEAIFHPPFKTKYVADDGIQSAKQFVRIHISDTGSGIAPEDLVRIFERLYQVDKSRKRDQGMGLGLAIAYNIVQVHGGDIQVTSEVGQGTRFTVWLPTKEADVSTLITRRQLQAPPK